MVSAYLTCLEQAPQLKAFNDIEVGTGVLTPVKTFVILVKEVLERQTNKNTVEFWSTSLPRGGDYGTSSR